MAEPNKKNVSFRMDIEAINKLEEIRQHFEIKANKVLDIGIEISKTKMLELIINAEYKNIFEDDSEEDMEDPEDSNEKD